jgi:hypothetical protein
MCGDLVSCALACLGDAIDRANAGALGFREVALALDTDIAVDDEHVWTFGNSFHRTNRFASSAVNAGFINLKRHDGLL